MNFRLDYAEFEKKQTKTVDKPAKKESGKIGLRGLPISIRGKRVVVTGVFPGRTRSEVGWAVASAGGVFQSLVVRNTNYLITGNTRGRITTKMRRAQQLGVEIIPYTEVTELR